MTLSAGLAPLLALGAAMFFGGAVNTVRRAVAHMDSQSASMVTIATTWAVFLLLAPFWWNSAHWREPVVWLFVANGVIHPVISRYLAYEANRRIGPTVAAAFDATSPLFAAGIALVLLGEHLTLQIALGTLLTVLGVVYLYWNPRNVPALAKAALLFATGAAAIRAINNNVGNFGLSHMPNPVMGAFISFGVSTLAAWLLFRWRTGQSLPRNLPRAGLWWCLITGVLSGVAVMCLYTALWLGDVVVVAPIVTAAPIFTLLFAWAFRQEVLSRRTLLGVLTVVTGVILVSLGR